MSITNLIELKIEKPFEGNLKRFFLFILLPKFTNLYVLIACKLRLQPINLRKVVKSGILWKILPNFSKNKRL